MAELQPFTVVGVYEDNGQPYVTHQAAEDAEHANAIANRRYRSRDGFVLARR